MKYSFDIEKYIHQLSKLNRAYNKELGFAPHKPILLLSIFELIKNGEIVSQNFHNS